MQKIFFSCSVVAFVISFFIFSHPNPVFNDGNVLIWLFLTSGLFAIGVATGLINRNKNIEIWAGQNRTKKIISAFGITVLTLSSGCFLYFILEVLFFSGIMNLVKIYLFG